MITLEFMRRIGLLVFIVGITALASTKPPEDTQLFSSLLCIIGIMLYLIPDNIKKEF
jgi:hypothetical protein